MMGYGRLGDLSGGPYYAHPGGDEKAAFDYYRKAVDVAESIVKADPNNQLARSDYATALMRAGMVLPAAGDVKSSLVFLRRAEAIFGEAFRQNPKVRFARSNLGLTWQYMARRFAASGDSASAIEWSQKALQQAQGLVKDEPDYAAARIDEMSAWDVLLHALASSGQRTDALAGARKVVEIALDDAAHGPKPAKMALLPPQAYGWLGDVYASLSTTSSTPADDWREAKLAWEKSCGAWQRIAAQAPEDAPARLAELERKIVDGEISLRAAAR
jgi:tetratricopeptide (TPR) repeat protein